MVNSGPSALDAVRAARRASAAGLGRWGVVVVSQVDNAAPNLLCAARLDDHDAKTQVRPASARPKVADSGEPWSPRDG